MGRLAPGEEGLRLLTPLHVFPEVLEGEADQLRREEQLEKTAHAFRQGARAFLLYCYRPFGRYLPNDR